MFFFDGALVEVQLIFNLPSSVRLKTTSGKASEMWPEFKNVHIFHLSSAHVVIRLVFPLPAAPDIFSLRDN